MLKTVQDNAMTTLALYAHSVYGQNVTSLRCETRPALDDTLMVHEIWGIGAGLDTLHGVKVHGHLRVQDTEHQHELRVLLQRLLNQGLELAEGGYLALPQLEGQVHFVSRIDDQTLTLPAVCGVFPTAREARQVAFDLVMIECVPATTDDPDVSAFAQAYLAGDHAEMLRLLTVIWEDERLSVMTTPVLLGVPNTGTLIPQEVPGQGTN